jgi:Membrane iron-sulfur containing protein FtrD-like
MDRFVLEALFTGAKEALKLLLCVTLVRAVLRAAGRGALMRAVAAGLLVVFLASFLVLRITVAAGTRELIVRMIGYVFGLFYLFSVGALYQATGTDLIGPLKALKDRGWFLQPFTALLTVLYFAPDMAGASLYLSDLGTMAGRTMPVLAAAGAAFVLLLGGGYAVTRNRDTAIARVFGPPQLLLALALIKLIAGGVHGFAELSLIPAVQAGLMKFVHDAVHQLLVLLLVPDHPVLTTTTWNFIGFVFREDAGLWGALFLLGLPALLFIRTHFTSPVAVPSAITTAPRKRIFLRAMRDERVLRSLPILAFLACILFLWFAERGETSARLYDPEPVPVTSEQGRVVIPLQTPTEDLRDGRIHKFSVLIDGKTVRLLILKRPEGALAVCLDACEICAPDGYAQGANQVVCLYCKTPIPFDTVGSPGGCNPIPLVALVTDKAVVLEIAEITEKQKRVQSAQGSGEGGR